MKTGLNSLKFIALGLTALLTLNGCLEKEKEETDGGSTNPSLSVSGTYTTSCVAKSGGALAGESHERYIMRFGVGGSATGFEFMKAYYSDSSCTNMVYGSVQQGEFQVGIATTTPANGYSIVLTVDATYVILYGATASSTIPSGCGSGISWQSTDGNNNRLGIVGTSFACADLTFQKGTLYNVWVVSGNTLNTGTPDDDNPGVTSASNISASAPITFTK